MMDDGKGEIPSDLAGIPLHDYEELLAAARPVAFSVTDERRAASMCYTSGTTGNPKGVVFHSRGAYLLAMGNVISASIRAHPVYLWSLPMFHCNGWCFPWTVAARAGVNVCLRRVDPKSIFDAIRAHGVPEVPTLGTGDPPMHKRYRALLAKAFTAPRVNSGAPECPATRSRCARYSSSSELLSAPR